MLLVENDDFHRLKYFPPSLPGAIFSSPSICAGRLVVGARDDRLYCIEMRELESSFLRAQTSSECALTDCKKKTEMHEMDSGLTLDRKMQKKIEALQRLLGT